MDNTATGSVEEISDQNSKHTKKGTSNQAYGRTKNNIVEINNADIKSEKIANAEIVFQLDINDL